MALEALIVSCVAGDCGRWCLVIDMHCHYLPGVDDGPKSLNEALSLLRTAAVNGITEAVLTPHIYPGVYDNRLSTLSPIFESFKCAAAAANIQIKLHLGAEVRLDPALLDLLDRDELPMLGVRDGMRVLLLEFPDGELPIGARQVCSFLLGHGVQPVIAHPERNKGVMRNPAAIVPFVKMGCLLQVTAASIIGRFGGKALRISQELIEQDLVGIVATDAHNLHARPPLLREAYDTVAGLYNPALARRLFHTTPQAILAGRP